MSDLVSARLVPLNALLLRAAEKHGRRLDRAAEARKVREADSLTWVPDGITGDPLALVDRLEEHVAGAVVCGACYHRCRPQAGRLSQR